jgi:hypothetical protein
VNEPSLVSLVLLHTPRTRNQRRARDSHLDQPTSRSAQMAIRTESTAPKFTSQLRQPPGGLQNQPQRYVRTRRGRPSAVHELPRRISVFCPLMLDLASAFAAENPDV